MVQNTTALDERLYEYFLDISLREPEILQRLRAETIPLPRATMLLAPEQGQFLALLMELTGAKRGIEVGTYTGYSSLCMASAMPEDGRLTCCDLNKEWTDIARRYWAEAGVSDKIDLRLGDAVETLDGLIAEGGAGTYDFVFIDADKPNYINYYERTLTLLRPGGLAIVDNVLWRGDVVDPTDTRETTEAVRAFNLHVRDDERVTLSVVPIGDGLTLARKRPD
jgi:predicted O-methyltransferase YrrM